MSLVSQAGWSLSAYLGREVEIISP